MPDRDLIAKLNANPYILANAMGLPAEWLSPATAADQGEAINVRVTPPARPGVSSPRPVYLFTIARRLGDVGIDELHQGVGREAARLRGELAFDGHLSVLPCADERERVMLAAVQGTARRAFPEGPALFDHQQAEAVVALVQLLGLVAEAQRHGKGEQLHIALMELTGHALGVARAVVGRG
jgi:hypothetical protein